MSRLVDVGLIVLLLALGALSALAQTAMERVSRVKAHHLAQRGWRGGPSLESIEADPGPFITMVLLIHVAAVVGAAVLAASRWSGAGGAAAVALTILAIFIFAELVPRIYAVQFAEKAALGSAGTVFVLGKLLGPIGRLCLLLANATMALLPGRALPKGPFAGDEELRDAGVEDEDEAIEEEERELIDSIFEFGDTVVREVMVPRPDMVTIPSATMADRALETSLKAGYSRIPVYEGDSDNIIGVLYAKDLMRRIHEGNDHPSVAELARPASFVPEQKKVAELLREMQQQHVHMAVVVDEYGGTAGLVTIEDLIEEIVGEIVDEYDHEEPLVEPIDDDTIRVDAKMPIDEVNDLLGTDLPHEEWDTVGGLVFDLTGRVPFAGETVRYDSTEFRTERVTGRRIQKVVITRVPADPEEEPEAAQT